MPRERDHTQTNQTQTRASRPSGSQHVSRRQDETRRASSREHLRREHTPRREHPPRRSDGESNDEEDNARFSSGKVLTQCRFEGFSANFYPAEIGQAAQVVQALHPPPSLVSDDDFSSQSDEVEPRPRKRIHIDLEAPENSDGRPIIRRHSPTENRWSADSGQKSATQTDLRKRLRTDLAWQQPHLLQETSTSEPQTPSDSASATSEGKLPRKFWKREFIPAENILVYDVAKLFLQAEVYTGQPWPSAADMENMIESA